MLVRSHETFKYTTHPVESFLLQRFTSSLPMPPIAALGATALSACCGRVERGQTLRLLPLGQHSVLWWQVKQMPTPAVGSMATRKGHFHSCARAQMRDLQKDTDPSAPSVATLWERRFSWLCAPELAAAVAARLPSICAEAGSMRY